MDPIDDQAQRACGELAEDRAMYRANRNPNDTHPRDAP